MHARCRRMGDVGADSAEEGGCRSKKRIPALIAEDAAQRCRIVTGGKLLGLSESRMSARFILIERRKPDFECSTMLYRSVYRELVILLEWISATEVSRYETETLTYTK